MVLLWALVPVRLWAADVSITATVDKTTAALEDYILLSITVEGTREEPALSGVEDFQVSSRGTSSKMSFVNGQMSSSYEYNYVLRPDRAGSFTIGPFSVEHKKTVYASNTVTLSIARGAVGNTNKGRKVYVTAGIDKENPYVHEQIIYSFKFYRRVQVGKANLTVVPDFEGFVSERLDKELEYRRVINGQTYSVTELRWALFPVDSGVLTIGPTALDCELIVRDRGRRRRGMFDDPFFGFSTRTERKSLRTDSLTVMVHPLPAAGKPGGFGQLVGEFELQGTLSEGPLHAGESATLTLRLSGNGNVRGVKTIDVAPMPNVKVYDDKPVFKADQAQKSASGTLIVKKALVPMQPGELTIPAVEVSYFNPAEKKYTTARTGPFTLSVLPSQQSESLQAVMPAGAGAPKEDVRVLGQDILPIYTDKDVIEDAAEPRLKLLHYMLAAAPVFLYVLVIIAYVLWSRAHSDSRRVRARSAWSRFRKQVPKLRRALSDTDSNFCGDAARALRELIGDMYGVMGSAMTPAEINALLSCAGVAQQLVKKIEHVLEQCDAGHYGVASDDASARRHLFSQVTRAARELHKSR
jgi:hypothetical protein